MTIIAILLAFGLCHFIRELGRFRKRQWLTSWVDFSNDAFGRLPLWKDVLGFLVIIAVPLLVLLLIIPKGENMRSCTNSSQLRPLIAGMICPATR